MPYTVNIILKSNAITIWHINYYKLKIMIIFIKIVLFYETLLQLFTIKYLNNYIFNEYNM